MKQLAPMLILVASAALVGCAVPMSDSHAPQAVSSSAATSERSPAMYEMRIDFLKGAVSAPSDAKPMSSASMCFLEGTPSLMTNLITRAYVSKYETAPAARTSVADVSYGTLIRIASSTKENVTAFDIDIQHSDLVRMVAFSNGVEQPQTTGEGLVRTGVELHVGEPQVFPLGADRVRVTLVSKT